nr:MAG TPA: hypothetical protein [Caudoviricetes sp.]
MVLLPPLIIRFEAVVFCMPSFTPPSKEVYFSPSFVSSC